MSLSWPDTLFSDGSGAGNAVLRAADGVTVPLRVGRWHEEASGEERDLLLGCSKGAVLDVGCGPGRHVLMLVRAGRRALGIDTSAAAVAVARRRGAPAVQTSVFGAVPAAGAWDTALLLDGNIGIGGDPAALLRRIHALLAPGGVVLAELSAPSIRLGRKRVRVEHGGRKGGWFAWAGVAADQADALAERSGFAVVQRWEAGGRWFAVFGQIEGVGDGS